MAKGFQGDGTFVRGDGTYEGTDVWVQNRDNSVKINAGPHDIQDETLADGLENCICKDGQQTVTADIPFAGKELTNIKSATARTSAAQVGDLQDGDYTHGGNSTGSSGAYVISVTPAVTVYVTGMVFSFRANHSPTPGTTATLNVNSVGAKDIILTEGANRDVTQGHILTGQQVVVAYDGTDDAFHLISSHGLSYEASISAAGTTQGAATSLNDSVDVHQVTSISAGQTGVQLPISSQLGRQIIVLNDTNTGTLKLYPPNSGNINNTGVNAAIDVGPDNGIIIFVASATQYMGVLMDS